jgi:hypothetical protein
MPGHATRRDDSLPALALHDAIGPAGRRLLCDAAGHEWLRSAWAVIDTPMLALPIGGAQAGRGDEPERALRLAIDLFALERQGRHRELMERRKRLRDLHAGLFASYVKTR